MSLVVENSVFQETRHSEAWVLEAPEIGRLARRISTGGHGLVADEPLEKGGTNTGPNPYDLLLAALGSCVSLTVRMYADHKQWPLHEIAVHLTHHKDENKTDIIQKSISLKGPLSEEQKQRLLEVADKCPVHRTLAAGVKIQSQLAD